MIHVPKPSPKYLSKTFYNEYIWKINDPLQNIFHLEK